VTLHKGCGHSIQGTDGPKVQDLGSEMVAGQRSQVKGQGSKVKGQRSKVKEDGLTSLDRRFKWADAADALG